MTVILEPYFFEMSNATLKALVDCLDKSTGTRIF
jgi:hypothetical protein